MKKLLISLTIIGLFTACGSGSSTSSESTTKANSTTPPPTADSTNPVGVMMSDTSTSVADSLNNQK